MNKSAKEDSIISTIKKLVSEIDTTVIAAERLVKQVNHSYEISPRLRESQDEEIFRMVLVLFQHLKKKVNNLMYNNAHVSSRNKYLR